MADLVIFDQSPLEDMKHVLGGKAVIKSGKPIALKPSLVSALEEALEAGLEDPASWLDEARSSARFGATHPIEIADLVRRLSKAGQVPAVRALIDLEPGILKKGPDGPGHIGESDINTFGYALLGADRIDDAIALFTLNRDHFPDSWNTHDSLGEAYLAKGDEENAALCYTRAVELNPENTHGLDVLERLLDSEAPR